MRLALLGGAGLIGSNIAVNMKRLGHEVLIVDSLAVNNKLTFADNPLYSLMIENRLETIRLAGVEFMQADARDYHALCQILGWWKPTKIVHLAAVAHIDRSNKDPFSTFDHNLRTLENALDYARGKVDQFVFFSSSTAYGDFQKPTIDEDEPCNPKGIYGSLKYAGELLTRAYRDTFDMPCTIIRPCALYGAGCVSGRVTQVFIEKAMKGEPITIYGDPDGRHDFTYIRDLVQGVELAMTEDNAIGETFNITGGNARSVRELAAIVKKHFPDLEIHQGPPDPEKPSRGTMSNAKAEKLLGYTPQWTLEAGMAEYVLWYRRLARKNHVLGPSTRTGTPAEDTAPAA